MVLQKLWEKESVQVATRSLAIYGLCLGIFYFYDRSVAYRETLQLGNTPYAIITLWWAWILFHNRVLILQLLFKKKWVLYPVTVLAGIIVTSLLQVQVLRFIGKDPPLPEALVSVSYYTLIGGLVFIAFLYMKQRSDFYKIATLKKEVELQQLKNQLNPHFLFNSLNNIYSYNLENNTYGNDLILKLSELMRFIVESTRKDHITLKEELGFIDNYVAFEKERVGHRCKIQYEENLGAPDRPIAPLLLFPFVENAFKHGTGSIEGGNVEIRIENTESALTLSVRNQIAGEKERSTKTGLSNVERRLDLLYPGRHQLDIRDDGREFFVQLTLDLS